MSAFIISTETMNRILNGLYTVNYYKTDGKYLHLATKLYAMNRDAVLQRYEKDDDYATPPEFVWEKKHISLIDAVKAMQCLRYQCSEGDVPKKPLYRWLTKTINEFNSRIVDDLPEYNKAEWD